MLRAAVLYIAAIWALAQGIAQLTPVVGAPEWSARGFLIAAAIGFPFWLAFAWIYELTPHGLKRESEIAPHESVTAQTGRKLDFAIIAVLTVAVLLLLGNQLLWHKGIARAPAATIHAVAKIPQKSVAVLPFANESGNKSEQFFSDGLSEDLINALSQFDGLKVISRNSAFQFRDSKDSSKSIGDALGVAHLLEGTVQRAEDEVRITVTLVNAADGSIEWSQRYNEPYTGLFALQDAITQAVADALKVKLTTVPGAVLQSDRPPGGNLAAYAAYQHGLAYDALNTEVGERKAIEALTEAVRLDPDYAAAYARLSFAWVNLVQFGVDDVAPALAQARAASDAALVRNPDSSLAHQARASLMQFVDMDWRGAEIEAQRALQLAPNDATAQYSLAQALASLGQNRRAVALTRQALASDPRHAHWYNWLAGLLAAMAETAEARDAANTAISLQSGAASFHEQLAVIEILQGDAGAALAAARQEPPGPWHDIGIALVSQIGMDAEAADAALQKLLKAYAEAAPYQIAQVYALRRDPDAMFLWLDRAWNVRDPGIGYLLFDPLILRYRGDARFAAFCKKVGLPATTDAVAMK